MAADARTKIVLELAAEFVEEHVRERSDQSFDMTAVKQSLGSMLHDADVAIHLRSGDDRWLSEWLDRHPFLLRQASGAAAAWKPGFNTGAIRGGQ